MDFITLDNASKDEFSDEQLKWLRGVLDRDLAPDSGIHAIVAGMHEALPHSKGAEHAMDDWEQGERTGDLVYTWFYDAQAAGKHVYLIASHSHYYSPEHFQYAVLEAALQPCRARIHHRISRGTAISAAARRGKSSENAHLWISAGN